MKRVFLFVTVILLPLGVLFVRYRWHELDYYIPENDLPLAASFRSMAEHDAFMQDKEWPYILRLDGHDSALLYYGSWHTNNPDDPQIAEIQEAWHDFQPTVAVIENRLGFFVGNLSMGVKAFAEFGAVYALAREDEIPIYTLEPPWEVEVAEMTAVFPPSEVTLFYTLRVFLSERGNADPDEIDDLALQLLRKRGSRPGLEGTLTNLNALDQLWAENYAELGDWRTLPPEAIHPSPEPNRLQMMANLANEIRDRHAARVILDLLAQGERVFAVAGGSHVVKQEPALQAGLVQP